MNKFNVGDKVKILGNMRYTGIEGFIESIDFSDESLTRYNIKLPISENILEKMEINEFEKVMFTSNYDELFMEMATVKWGFMSIKLAIYGKERSGYPHFHFFKGLKPEGGIPDEYRNGGGCLCIESPNYFIHENHVDTLTPKEIKGLIKFLREQNKTFKSISNWEYIIGQWNDNNPEEKQIPMDTPIPDYKSNMSSVQE